MAIEECNEQGKNLLVLDQHQVRTWTAFHHHIALCLFAHAFAATRRAHAQTLATTRRVLAVHTRDLADTGYAASEGAHRETARNRQRPERETPFPRGES